MNQSLDLTESYYRFRQDAGFLDTFYELLLSKSPEIREKFSQTDFKLQKLMLRQSLLEMICFDRGLSGTEEEIERLGRRHKELAISPPMYEMWLDALCEAIAKHDPQYTSDLEQVWRKAMRKSIVRMINYSATSD